jgi:hypothetical protein
MEQEPQSLTGTLRTNEAIGNAKGIQTLYMDGAQVWVYVGSTHHGHAMYARRYLVGWRKGLARRYTV